jgi:NADPH:quinone reductase-like Zn-dependent oxidoreductase
MRALLYRRYGSADVLEVGEIEAPRPGRGEVLVRVHAAAVNPKDVLVRKGKFRRITGRRFPRVPGYDLAGEIEAVGSGVQGFTVGAPVFGMINRWAAGATAELAVLPEGELAPKPARLSWAEAAAVPLAALTALQALRDLGRVGPQTRVCINGASGGVGVFAVQIARILGAHVTTVSSARNLELCTRLGADEALDYGSQDPLQPNQPYDVFFDVFGNQPFEAARCALATRARYVTTIPKPKTMAQNVLTRLSRRPVRLVIVRSNRPDLETLAGWLEAGELEPVIDQVLPLEAGADAHRHVETKRARGKVVLLTDRCE